MPRSSAALGQVGFSQLRRSANMVHLPGKTGFAWPGLAFPRLERATGRAVPCTFQAVLFASADERLLRCFHVLLRGLAHLQQDPGQSSEKNPLSVALDTRPATISSYTAEREFCNLDTRERSCRSLFLPSGAHERRARTQKSARLCTHVQDLLCARCE